jgi:hypothetical protein
MSRESVKGYRFEHLLEDALRPYGSDVHRPRTTARANGDVGDFRGLPLIVSAKNHNRMDLATWVDEVVTKVDKSPIFPTGVVIHKRKGRADVMDQYVTTSFGLWLPMLRSYVEDITGHLYTRDVS